MKYWLLTSEFPPDFGGGISTYCLETAQMLSSFGHNVTVITQNFQATELSFNNSTFKSDDSSFSFRVVKFNPNKYYTRSFLGYEANLSYAFSQIVKELALKEGVPDIVESQEYMGIAYYILQYKWLDYPVFKDLKIVVTLHAPSFVYLEYNKVPCYQLPYYWIGEMERFCILSADLLISPSQYIVNEIKNRVRIEDLSIHIVRNPYNINIQASDLAHQITKPPNHKIGRILFFGKLIPQKGCLELIDYFKQLWNEGFEHSLVMIGGGAHLYHPEGVDMIDFIKKEYKAEIRAGSLQLLGAIPPQMLYQHIEDAHVIIIPSIVDNLPYTVLEVMGRSKVVLASVQGGQSEIIENDVDGFLFDHNDISSFKNQIKHIVSLSEEAIKEIGVEAFNKIRNEFSYKSIYEKKIELLQKLMSKEQSSSYRIFPLIRPNTSIDLASVHSPKSFGEEGLLSIVIPYYNMGEYVEEAVKSTINSMYKNIEILIVNDGSVGKENLEVLNKLQNNSRSIRVIHKENEGLALARNTGAMEAKGQFLAFLDPDDTVDSGYYEKAINILQKYDNLHFVGCWAKYFGNTKGYWPAFNPEPPYLLFHNMLNSSALVYKKEAFLKAGLNDPQMVFGMEDYESVISLLENGYNGVVLPEPLWNYRVRNKSMSREFTKTKQIFLYKLIAEKHKAFFATFADEITNLLNANGPGFNYDNPTLFYNLTGSRFINSKIGNRIVSKIKSNMILRRVAIKIRKSL